MAQQGFDTLKVRAGYNSEDHNYSVAVPIYQTASFDLGDTERLSRLQSFKEFGYFYTRLGNPTVSVLEQRVAALDGATGAIALASGMAALSYTFLALAEGGGRIVASPFLYGGTFDSFTKILGNFGVYVDFVERPDDAESWADAIGPETKAVFIETVSNPNAVLLDVDAIAKVAHSFSIPLVVDNTLATPYLFKPFGHGADLVIYSATKALGGHGTTIGGLVLENGKFKWERKFPHFAENVYILRDRKTEEPRSFLSAFPESPFTVRLRFNYLAYLGAALSPFDAYLLLQGIETLSERVSKQVANTEKIVRFLQNHRKVAWVKHPSAHGSPYASRAKKDFPRGAGSVFSFGFKGDVEESEAFINATKLFSYHANVGDARSLIIDSPKTTHGELLPQELEFAGIPQETIRLSIGLEDANDLIADLEQAFKEAEKVVKEKM